MAAFHEFIQFSGAVLQFSTLSHSCLELAVLELFAQLMVHGSSLRNQVLMRFRKLKLRSAVADVAGATVRSEASSNDTFCEEHPIFFLTRGKTSMKSFHISCD